MFLTHACAKWNHFDMKADPTDVDKIAFLCLLFLYTVSVPFQVVLDPLINAFSANDAKVSQSIIGEVENLGYSVMCPHEVVCHDGDEALVVFTHTFDDEVLHDLIELTAFIEYEIDRFHFLITLLTR